MERTALLNLLRKTEKLLEDLTTDDETRDQPKKLAAELRKALDALGPLPPDK